MDFMILVAQPIPALILLTSQEKGILVTSEASRDPQEKDSKSGWLIRHGGPPCGHCSLPTGMTTGLRLLHLSVMAPKLHQCPHITDTSLRQPVSQGKGHAGTKGPKTSDSNQAARSLCPGSSTCRKIPDALPRSQTLQTGSVGPL